MLKKISDFYLISFCLIFSNFLIGQTKSDTSKCKLIQDDISKRDYYLNTETPPEYPEGKELIFAYLKNNIKVPSKCYEKSQLVFLSYIVETSGKLTLLNVLRSTDPALTKELIRVISTMPKWIPATCNKKPVPAWLIIPFKFTIR